MRRIHPRSLMALLALLLAGVAAPTAPAAAAPHPAITAPESLHVTARAAFSDLLRQSAASKARLSGMPSAEEAPQADLGEPLPVAMVRLDRLKAAQPGDRLADLMDRLDSVVYPVQVNAEARAELEMSLIDGAWRAASVGGTGHARVVAGLRQKQRGAAFLLRVPALHAEFLAQGEGEGLLLTPLFEVAGAGLAAGKALAAAEVMERLLPLARATVDRIP